MKALLLDGFGGPEVMHLGDADRPRPGPDQLLIRVAATSVNRPDLLQREGRYPPPDGESDILGLEAAGTVEARGDNVRDFSRGERVMALLAGGGYAEYALAYAAHVMRIPDAMSFEQAACVCETYITAYMNLFIGAALEDGETVLVHGGGGGIGTAALQLCATLAPQSPVISTASAGKIDRVRTLGAQRVVDYRNEDFTDAVLAETDGRGADVILDHIGAAYLQSNMKALAVDGRLALIGVMGGPKAEINLAVLLVRRQRIIGSVLRTRPIAQKAAIIARFRRAVLPLFAEQRIAPIIDQVYPLGQAADAHRTMERSGHFGKLVLRVRE